MASLLKLNQQTIRNWIDRGTLPAVRVGPRRVRIRRVDLDRLLGQGSTGGQSTAPTSSVWDGDVPLPAISLDDEPDDARR